MASGTIIKEKIRMIATTYSLWTIGLTINPGRREVEIGSPTGWRLFEASSEEVAKNVEAHFVRNGMKGDTGGSAFGANYVFIYMGLKSDPKSTGTTGQNSPSNALPSPKNMTQFERYLADFEVMYGNRPDYDFLRRHYVDVVNERKPNHESVPELLSELYTRLESLGIEVTDLAFTGSNKTPPVLSRRHSFRRPIPA
jgi:hypothetical protein